MAAAGPPVEDSDEFDVIGNVSCADCRFGCMKGRFCCIVRCIPPI